MCDYSLHSVKSRLAKVSDKLTTHDFGTGTRGFAASEDMNFARKHQHPLQCIVEKT
jgi:hypothetical protein